MSDMLDMSGQNKKKVSDKEVKISGKAPKIHQLEVGTHGPHSLEPGPHEPTPTKVLNVMCLLGIRGSWHGMHTSPYNIIEDCYW